MAFSSAKNLVFLGKPLSDWALIVPVVIIVYAFLFIVAWIGWAMASTPLHYLPRRLQRMKKSRVVNFQ